MNLETNGGTLHIAQQGNTDHFGPMWHAEKRARTGGGVAKGKGPSGSASDEMEEFNVRVQPWHHITCSPWENGFRSEMKFAMKMCVGFCNLIGYMRYLCLVEPALTRSVI